MTIPTKPLLFNNTWSYSSLKKTLFLLLLLVFPFDNAFSQTDHYVRPSGGNYGLEDGSDYDNAWDGFANINWTAVDSGNGKLFVAGIHRDQMIVNTSGESGTPVQVTSCTTANGASTNDPGTINGADIFSTWASDGDDYYSAYITEPTLVIVSGTVLTEVAELIDLDANSEWWNDTEKKRVYINYNAANETVEVGQRSHCINLTPDITHVTIDGLIFEKSNYNGVYVNGPGAYTIIQNCTIRKIGGKSGLYSGMGIRYYHLDPNDIFTIANNTISDVYRTAVWIYCSDSVTKNLDGSSIYGNNIDNAGSSGIAIDWGKNIHIFNNIIYNVSFNVPYSRGISLVYSDSIDVYQNRIAKAWDSDSHWNVSCIGLFECSNVNIYRNLLNDARSCIHIDADSTVPCNGDYRLSEDNSAYYNITYGCGIGIYIEQENDGTSIYNNICYENSHGIRFDGNCAGENDNNFIKNNILTSPLTDTDYSIYVDNIGTGYEIDYNLYYEKDTTEQEFHWLGTNYCVSGCPSGNDWMQFKTDTRQDQSSPHPADPQFVNASIGNFHLQATSPCINTGKDIGLTQDYNGFSVPQGSSVDIGAFEYQADTTLPAGTITINNGATVTYSLNVILTLFATDNGEELSNDAMMEFSNDNQEWSDPEPYTNTKIWTLSPGVGVKTVYVKFGDSAGNWMAEPAQDQIIYDDTTLPTHTIIINNGATVTHSLNVFLTLFATYDGQELGGNALMTFSNDNQEWSNPESYANTKLWTLSPGEGVKTVYVKFRDAAGNWMIEPAQDQIIYATTENTCNDPQKLQPVTITASSQFGPFYAKDKAVDGNPSTAWSTFLSFFKKDEFITLDLGEMKKLSGLNMYASKLFGTDFFPTNFQIEISRDNTTWEVVSTEQGYTPPIQPTYPDSWDFNSLECRFVRIYITKTKNFFLFFHVAQISEIEIYGCDTISPVPLLYEKGSLIKHKQPERNHLEESKDIRTRDRIPPSTPGKPIFTFPEQ